MDTPHQSITTEQIVIIVGVLVFLGILLYIILTQITHPVSIRCQKLEWRRIIHTEKYVAHSGSGLAWQVPSNAYDVEYFWQNDPHYETKIVHVPDGHGGHRTESKQELVFRLQQHARYKTNSWDDNGDLTTAGGPNDERHWPQFTSQDEEKLGNVRASGHEEQFIVCYVQNDHADNKYEQEVTEQHWREYVPEKNYTVRVNLLGQPKWATLTDNLA